MSFNKEKLRDFIIKTFMGPQAPRNTNQKADSELDSFVEIPKTESKDNLKTKSTKETSIKPENQYRYLEQDVLSKEFSFDREPAILEKKPHKIALCLFKVNNHTSPPFVEFMFQNINGTYKFPEADLNMETFSDIIKKENPIKINIEDTDASVLNQQPDDDGENEIDKEFFNQCSQLFQKSTSLDSEIAYRRYLGFVEKDGIIFIFFDCTNIDTSSLEAGQYDIGIIDEIVNIKTINNIPIEPTIVQLFASSPLLTHMYRGQGVELPYPKLVFLCETSENGEYKNAYYAGSQKTISIINPKVEHAYFGYVYLFSPQPLISGENTGLVQGIVKAMTNTTDIIKRFALFTDSAKIYKEVDPNTAVDKNYECYGFTDKGRELWAVKSTTLFNEL